MLGDAESHSDGKVVVFHGMGEAGGASCIFRTCPFLSLGGLGGHGVQPSNDMYMCMCMYDATLQWKHFSGPTPILLS